MAQILGLLGHSRIANNLNQLAFHANTGTLLIDDQTTNQINEAYIHVLTMRAELVKSPRPVRWRCYMMLKASQRAGGTQLAHHLLNDRDNDHVEIHELRGFISNDLVGAFKEAYAISTGTKCQQFLFSLSLSPPELRYFQGWGHLSLSEIGANRKGVRERHKQISKEHGPYIANRAMRALRAAYNLALKVDDTLPANPVVAVTFNREKRRDQAIIPDELPNWWREVEAHDNPIQRDLQKFILLTGMRRTAAVTARREDLDSDRGLLFVPDSKGGEERAFWLPLSDYLVDLLDARQSENEVACQGSPWLWPADSATGHVTEPKENKRGLPSPHMLRHYLPRPTMSSSLDRNYKRLRNKEIFHRGTQATRHSQFDLQAVQEPKQIVAGLEAG